MSYGLVRQVGPWKATKEDTRFQSYDGHRNFIVDPKLQGAPAPPQKISVFAQRSVIDKRPFMPFRRTNNYRVSINPYGHTKPSLGDSYAGDMGAGGRTLGSTPSKDLPGDRMNPIDNVTQIKYEGYISKEEDGFPGVEPVPFPGFAEYYGSDAQLSNYAYDTLNTAIAATVAGAAATAGYVGSAASMATRTYSQNRQMIDAALAFIQNSETAAHLVLPPEAASLVSSGLKYKAAVSGFVKRALQSTANAGAGNVRRLLISAITSSGPQDPQLLAHNAMYDQFLAEQASAQARNEIVTNGFLATIFAILQIISLNQGNRQRAVGRVMGEVNRINAMPQMRQIADVAANTGRGMIEGAVRSYRNA